MESMQQAMGTDKKSSNLQCMLQNLARRVKESYNEAGNLTEHNNNQQHTIRT
jgi:YD repeat-containing protein